MGLVSVKFNADQFRRALESLSQEMGWTMAYTGLRTAKFMCFDSLVFTPPFVRGGGKGNTPEAGRVGEAAVERDIRAIFTAKDARQKTSGSLILQRLAWAGHNNDSGAWADAKRMAQGIVFENPIVTKLVQDPDTARSFKKAQNFFSRASKIGTVAPDQKKARVLTMSELAPIHERLRTNNRRGRFKVTKSQGDYLGKFLVESKTTLNAYIKKRQAQEGKTKAAWLSVLNSLPDPPTRGSEVRIAAKQSEIAKYIRRHASNGQGYQSYFFTPRGVMITFGNRIADRGDTSSRNNVQGLVLNRAYQRMDEALRNADSAATRKRIWGSR